MDMKQILNKANLLQLCTLLTTMINVQTYSAGHSTAMTEFTVAMNQSQTLPSVLSFHNTIPPLRLFNDKSKWTTSQVIGCRCETPLIVWTGVTQKWPRPFPCLRHWNDTNDDIPPSHSWPRSQWAGDKVSNSISQVFIYYFPFQSRGIFQLPPSTPAPRKKRKKEQSHKFCDFHLRQPLSYCSLITKYRHNFCKDYSP